MQPLEQRKILQQIPGQKGFSQRVKEKLRANDIEILQINLGHRCNLACKHCHVEAHPDSDQVMARKYLEKCLNILREYSIGTVDLTGGAPEMHPDLEWFIKAVSQLNRRLLVRTNLVVLLEEEYQHFPKLFADHKVEVVASLPAYRSAIVDRIRGNGVFDKSLKALKLLNDLGYGQENTGLIIDLVYNPAGSYLPGGQAALESEYKTHLKKAHDIVFNSLFTITNSPVGRFLEYLVRSDNYVDYMTELVDAYNEHALANVMCKSTLSIGWDGTLYDCDFNQMLKMPVDHGAPSHLSKFDFQALKSREIVVGNHCYCCTAGAGSSCQEAIDE